MESPATDINEEGTIRFGQNLKPEDVFKIEKSLSPVTGGSPTPRTHSPKSIKSHLNDWKSLEKKFPHLNYLLNQRSEWNALFKILKTTEEIINTRKIYRKQCMKNEIQELVNRYKQWWMHVRTSQLLQDVNIRKLSKFVRAFIIAALEEPTHSIAIRHITSTEKKKAKSIPSKFSPRTQLTSLNSSRIAFSRGSKVHSRISMGVELDLFGRKLSKGYRSQSQSRQLFNSMPDNIQRLIPNTLRKKRSTSPTSSDIESIISLPIYPSGSNADVNSLEKVEERSSSFMGLDIDSMTAEENYYLQIIFKDILRELAKRTYISFTPMKQSYHRHSISTTVNPRFHFKAHPAFHPKSAAVICAPSPRFKIFPTKTSALTALNEMKKLRKGFWTTYRINAMCEKHPDIVQDTKNFHAKKSMMIPQERAKTILRSECLTAYNFPVRNLGVKSYK